MTVIEDLGLSVSVHVNGEALVEYDDLDVTPDTKYPNSRIVSRYIESKDNTEYHIACQVLPQHTWLSGESKRRVSFHAYTDGKWQCATPYAKGHQSRQVVGLLAGPITRPHGAADEILTNFKFNSVTTVDVMDRDAIKEDMKAAASLGVIRVEVWRCLDAGSSQAPTENGGLSKFSVAEKALKGRSISHGTAFSPPVKLPAQKWHKNEKLGGQPYAIFLFKYRSKDALRNEMVIPRTPSPEPAPKGIAGLSQEEINRLAEERLAEIKKEKKPVIKRDFDEVYDLTGGDGDGSPRPIKVLRRRKAPETVDLSED